MHSVESLLSALECCGVDNARIEIEGGEEVPVVDGSAMGWAINIVVCGLQPAHAAGDSAAEPQPRRAHKPSKVCPWTPNYCFSLSMAGVVLDDESRNPIR